MSDHETKAIDLRAAEVKVADDGWSFSGYASTFGGEPDSYGDVVHRRAFERTIADNPKPPLLWSHNMADVVGVPLELKADSKGLYGTWRIVRHDVGTRAYENLKAGAVTGLSIGFYALDFDEDRETGTRKLLDVDLVEVSLVAVPANKRAQVHAVRQRAVALDTDVKFADLFAQLGPIYETLVGEAEALRERRAQDQRELSEAHIDALDRAIAEAEAFAGRLSALRTAPPTETEVEATEALTARLRHARWQLAQDLAERRRRYAAAHILETVQ